jgi:hypothetical protein
MQKWDEMNRAHVALGKNLKNVTGQSDNKKI